MSARIEKRFVELAVEGRAALVTFVTAGDPDLATSREILFGLPEAGADLIELGMPFTDPMADGPSIQASSLRALKAGATLRKTLALVREFRLRDAETPIILMGYFNPIHSYGVPAFLADARSSGVDGLIIVDLPPEEDEWLCLPAQEAGIAFIRLATPTTSDKRLPAVLRNAGGFLYYVSYTGITGARSLENDSVRRAIDRLRRHTGLPVAVGFGIKTPEQAGAIAHFADAVVIGSAIVERIAAGQDPLGFVRELSHAVRDARK